MHANIIVKRVFIAFYMYIIFVALVSSVFLHCLNRTLCIILITFYHSKFLLTWIRCEIN